MQLKYNLKSQKSLTVSKSLKVSNSLTKSQKYTNAYNICMHDIDYVKYFQNSSRTLETYTVACAHKKLNLTNEIILEQL